MIYEYGYINISTWIENLNENNSHIDIYYFIAFVIILWWNNSDKHYAQSVTLLAWFLMFEWFFQDLQAWWVGLNPAVVPVAQ